MFITMEWCIAEVRKGFKIFRSAEFLQRNHGIGGMIGRSTCHKKKRNIAKLTKETIARLIKIF